MKDTIKEPLRIYNSARHIRKYIFYNAAKGNVFLYRGQAVSWNNVILSPWIIERDSRANPYTWRISSFYPGRTYWTILCRFDPGWSPSRANSVGQSRHSGDFAPVVEQFPLLGSVPGAVEVGIRNAEESTYTIERFVSFVYPDIDRNSFSLPFVLTFAK